MHATQRGILVGLDLRRNWSFHRSASHVKPFFLVGCPPCLFSCFTSARKTVCVKYWLPCSTFEKIRTLAIRRRGRSILDQYRLRWGVIVEEAGDDTLLRIRPKSRRPAASVQAGGHAITSLSGWGAVRHHRHRRRINHIAVVRFNSLSIALGSSRAAQISALPFREACFRLDNQFLRLGDSISFDAKFSHIEQRFATQGPFSSDLVHRGRRSTAFSTFPLCFSEAADSLRPTCKATTRHHRGAAHRFNPKLNLRHLLHLSRRNKNQVRHRQEATRPRHHLPHTNLTIRRQPVALVAAAASSHGRPRSEAAPVVQRRRTVHLRALQGCILAPEER